MDTLAVRLAVPLAGPALDFNQLVSAPCWAHNEKSARKHGLFTLVNSSQTVHETVILTGQWRVGVVGGTGHCLCWPATRRTSFWLTNGRQVADRNGRVARST